jgi:hypothetical protein
MKKVMVWNDESLRQFELWLRQAESETEDMVKQMQALRMSYGCTLSAKISEANFLVKLTKTKVMRR